MKEGFFAWNTGSAKQVMQTRNVAFIDSSPSFKEGQATYQIQRFCLSPRRNIKILMPCPFFMWFFLDHSVALNFIVPDHQISKIDHFGAYRDRMIVNFPFDDTACIFQPLVGYLFLRKNHIA